MPPVPVPNNAYMLGQFSDWEMRLRALETQQQAIISNLQGQPVVAFGLQPGSNPPEYGIGLLNKAYGTTMALFGEDSAGNVALKFYDASGNLTISIDYQGLHVWSASGTEEARLGLLNASPAIYGLAVLNASSVLQQVAGTDGASGGSGTATSSTQVDLGASVTSIIGPSGEAMVTICGSVENNSAAGTSGYAYMGVSIDGASATTNWINAQSNLASSQLTLSLSASRLVTGLSAGSHTFAAKGWVGTGVSSGVYGNVAVTVQPL